MTTLSHLQRLEAESIHIMREVVATCSNPVMLYSIGKHSSVMQHLAMKAQVLKQALVKYGAVEFNATTLSEIIQEKLLTTASECEGRAINKDRNTSMEQKKQGGYF